MSINDPRWGNNNDPDNKRKDPQGPPDLEDLWRDFNQRLSGAFGKRPGGGSNDGGGGGRPSLGPRQLGGGVFLVVAAVLVLWLASGFYIVDAGERGIVLRFGKADAVTPEGLQWRLPFPFESHEIVNVTNLRTVEIGYRGADRSKDLHESLMLTDDENIISIQFAVQYTLSDPSEFLFNNREPEKTVKQVAETAIREIVGKSKMDFVLYEGREAIAKDAQILMQKILNDYKTGISISKVTMQNAQPPEQVQEAFNDAVKASQDQERLKNEGQSYFNDVVPKAEGAAARLREEAMGYAARVVSQAEGDAARFKSVFAEYAKAPEVTRNRMYIDAMQQVYSSTSKVLIDAKGNGNLLYLPLDKLMQASGAQGAATETLPAANTGKPAVQETPAPNGRSAEQNQDYRNREAMRSRERGER
ncbi:MAG: FtsH protease activity modulator HflK [Uliginosibacterium sp.]|jgi:membrane protease subunit HflK|nr:FtsH protease activity modulator HflK [Uliginosibacterium sp.]